jgi:DNA processing protein
MDERTALLALSRTKGIHAAAKKALAADTARLAAIFAGRERTGDGSIDAAIRAFKGFAAIKEDLAELPRLGAEVVTIKDAAYPPMLARAPDAPVALYKKGPLPFPEHILAVVGARRASPEGLALAESIGETLSSVGVCVVSGLARGIDAAAQRGALKGKGKTVGVLGCGIDVCYPSENRALFDSVGRDGAIVTEYAPGTPAFAYNFPERNRIIAGLSKGVLVVEASRKSGSLITARLALEYGREVLAIPGAVFEEGHQGANNLIKKGAHLVEDIGDILSCCFPALAPGVAAGRAAGTKVGIDLSGDEGYIFKLLGAGRVHVDEIIERSRFETRRVMAALTRLEMKDAVQSMPGGFYIRKV